MNVPLLLSTPPLKVIELLVKTDRTNVAETVPLLMISWLLEEVVAVPRARVPMPVKAPPLTVTVLPVAAPLPMVTLLPTAFQLTPFQIVALLLLAVEPTVRPPMRFALVAVKELLQVLGPPKPTVIVAFEK
ncbi:MAG: hypothetical protein PCFJNLEI_04221 [Verrucomicrobiae bacterium]|nr:hypothetical protein [Verrucomicrobiae bacterium]